MKSIDNTINYYELLMGYDDTSNITCYELPKGFHYELYKDGDESDWININLSCGNFHSINDASKYFHLYYDSFINELNKRCIFIVDNNTKDKIATVTISHLKKEEYGYKAAIDWMGIKKEYQKKGLSKPLISQAIKLSNELGYNKIILHTQTTTWLAAKIYLDIGFNPLNICDTIGWKILKRITNHEKLIKFDNATDDEMYDKRNIAIEKQLDSIYGANNYSYSVWYKNGLHNVYVYCNKVSHEYEYFEDNNKIRLNKIK